MDQAERLQQFKTDGYTIFKQMLDAKWIRQMVARFADLKSRSIDGEAATSFTDMLEHEPSLTLQAITLPPVLDFAELLIGPHVQLESITFIGFPSVATPPSGSVSGWHRDMFASYPTEGVYQHPLLFNAAVYLQDLTDANGPLRVLTGSHQRAMTIPEGLRYRQHPEETVLYPKAGDVVLFHNSLLHSGTPNTSEDPRYFFCITYNHAWLKHRGNYSGPNARALIARARQSNDRRLLRLLGIDDSLFERANSGFLTPDEQMWQKWIEEDRAHMRVK